MLHDSDLFAVYDKFQVSKKFLISEAMSKLVASKKTSPIGTLTFIEALKGSLSVWTSWGQENCLSTPKGSTGSTTSVGSSR